MISALSWVWNWLGSSGGAPAGPFPVYYAGVVRAGSRLDGDPVAGPRVATGAVDAGARLRGTPITRP